MLTAMAEVSAERGAANVTVAHVVARSGVSRRTFYEQFHDCEDCFLSAVEEALSRAAMYVLPAYATEDRWRERIRNALIATLCFLEQEPYMGRLLVVETLGAGSRALKRRQQALAHLQAAVDEGRQEAKGTLGYPPLTAEGVVGGVLSVIHARLLDPTPGASLLDLTGQLMSMIVLPYLGVGTARRELQRPVPTTTNSHRPPPANPLRDLNMRLTYRTMRVLLAIANHPGASNRELGIASEISDQGQISKLLARLEKLGLIENRGEGHARGAPNAWTLTAKGCQVEQAITQQTSTT
jgi:AcrR family transcriptional regulator/DNA-binding MarR family transcriptional regulator